MNPFKNTSVTRVANLDNNTHGFKFKPFANFTSRTFTDVEVVDVIGMIISISDAIPFNNFVQAKIRRTLILEDVEYKVIVRVIDETGSASLLLFDDLVYKLTSVQCYTLIRQYGEDYDDYFPSKLNGLIGKKLLFRFYYTAFNINNNNHVYQVQRISQDEAMIDIFKKDFIEDQVDDIQTPLPNAAGSRKFITGDNIPFNLEDTPNSAKGIAFSEVESSSSGSGRRTIINVDDYNEADEADKRAKKLIQVK
ncbi:replication protein A 70 kDa DNA-binding subunit B, partial [Tanacetum coccineum]